MEAKKLKKIIRKRKKELRQLEEQLRLTSREEKDQKTYESKIKIRKKSRKQKQSKKLSPPELMKILKEGGGLEELHEEISTYCHTCGLDNCDGHSVEEGPTTCESDDYFDEEECTSNK